ncbi:MAG: aminopeptidase P family protein [Saprospiraceae bacterium]|nr:aminopeptidase P family protein [Saprospiraceae bacterium]
MKILPEEYNLRIDALKAKISFTEIDAFIASEEEDIYYLTGLTYKSLERLFILVITEKEVSFILPKMELAHLQSVNHVDSIMTYREYPAPKEERWQDILFEVLENSKKIGLSGKCPFEISDFLDSASYKVQKSSALEELRWVKSNSEIDLIERAAGYCDFAVDLLNARAYYGMTELEVFSIGKTIQQKLIKETDFDYLSTNVLFAAWPGRISHQPHGIPKVSDVLKEGSHISLAFLRVNGYAAELERTFFTTNPTHEQIEIFNIMLEARRRAYNALKAGVTGEEVDLAAKDYLIDKGFKDNIMHRTGHGIGLGNHEGPYLAEGDATILKENMVVSIEPGIYIEGLGGFRHSDTVRVTRDGYEILTSCPDDVESLTFTSFRPIQQLKGAIIKKMFRIN